jgi:hypothetical protein
MLQAQKISVLIWHTLLPVGFLAAFNLGACLPAERSEAKLLNSSFKINKIRRIIILKLSDHESLSALLNALEFPLVDTKPQKYLYSFQATPVPPYHLVYHYPRKSILQFPR